MFIAGFLERLKVRVKVCFLSTQYIVLQLNLCQIMLNSILQVLAFNKYHPKKLRSWPAWSLAARRSLVRDCELAAASNVPKSRQRQPATPAPAENWKDFSPASAIISRGHQYLPGRLWGGVFNLCTLGRLWNSSMDFSFLSAQGWLMYPSPYEW